MVEDVTPKPSAPMVEDVTPKPSAPMVEDVTPKPSASLEIIISLNANVGYYIVFGLIICFLIDTVFI